MTSETSKKHKWSTFDNIMICVGYLLFIKPHGLNYVLYYIPLESIEMKYKNCLYLHKGEVEGSLKHVSKDHKKVWDFIYNYSFLIGIGLMCIAYVNCC